MRFLMKNWKIGAYFGSIALAVTIGMFQTTPKEGMTMGSKANCTHAVKSNDCQPTATLCGIYNTCTSKESGGADICNSLVSTRCYYADVDHCNTLVLQQDHAGLTYRECDVEQSP
jgi:hypothetical protein